MTKPLVKIGDTIRRARPWATFDGEKYYVHATIDTPEAAEHATELVASGRWVVAQDNNERKDEP